MGDRDHCFELLLHYEEQVIEELLPLVRLAMTMPLLNYGLFTNEMRLDFPIAQSDMDLINDLLLIFSRDIFINKLVRRRADYVLHEFLPKEDEITEKNAQPRASIIPHDVESDRVIKSGSLEKNSCGVLSSGGKESLLTYGMLKEIGADVHPLYVNESGGHWRTALTAYRYHKEWEPNCTRVWTNVDRFYNFMLENMRIIRSDFRRVWADTYPIRLCIFPFYVFLLLPIFIERGIGNLLIGSEFDDPRIVPIYHGIPHYFGVYDQTQDYDIRMEEWYKKRIPRMRQWSAVRPISGLVVERILGRRFPHLAALQRSCHSCHFEKDGIAPCGRCSKCLGVLLFLSANGLDPELMNFSKGDILSFPKRVKDGKLRLDSDERDHAFYLASKHGIGCQGMEHPHIETMHVNPQTSDPNHVPRHFRKGLLDIIQEYTGGYSILDGENWIPK